MGDTTVRITLSIPGDLYAKYEQQAEKSGRSVDAEIVNRLSRCHTHTSITPLYFNDDQRARLSKALGRTISDPETILSRLHNLIDLNVGKVKVTVPERVALRLKTRTPRGKTSDQYVEKVVVEALERETGLRPW